MKKNFVWLVVALAIQILIAKDLSAATEQFKLIRVTELSKWINADSKNLYIYDANTDEVRKSSGLIPGAKALASVFDFDPSATLPGDKSSRLVFYCANQQCMASHAAAQRAASAGYTSVFVMSDGIRGWIRSGKKTQPYL